ncbi:MAG: carboxypeptidase-like regulatory domain-containing protein [Alphaproteobacteria bacterium]|nr:carboxypeptidase-like regulatory domain-containing protein [Alphaproteobacteria bacterium]
MRQAVIAILGCLALSGCHYIPDYILAPPLHGVLEKDGKPVVGAEVRTIYNRRSSSKAVTDAQGRFRTEEVTEVETAFPMGDPGSYYLGSYYLEVVFAGERYATRRLPLSKEGGGEVVCQIPDRPEKQMIRDVEDGQNREIEVRGLSCRWPD